MRILLARESDFLGSSDGAPSHKREIIFDKIQGLSPDDTQRSLKGQATSLAIQLGQTRWLMFEQRTVPIPKLLLGMLIFWLTVLFISFGLFAPRDLTVLIGLFIAGPAFVTAIAIAFLGAAAFSLVVVGALVAPRSVLAVVWRIEPAGATRLSPPRRDRRGFDAHADGCRHADRAGAVGRNKWGWRLHCSP